MQVGQQVVCIDDVFPKPLLKFYVNLPVKGNTYTIRAVYLGRTVMFPSAPGSHDGEIGILLQEIINPPDPRNKYSQELGFKSDRFRPLESMDRSEENEEEGELVLAHPEPQPETATQ
jgi:hypothetical protein